MTKEAMEYNKDSLLWKEVEEEGKVSGRTAFNAMRKGDASAKSVKSNNTASHDNLKQCACQE